MVHFDWMMGENRSKIRNREDLGRSGSWATHHPLKVWMMGGTCG